jgi:hypothetical protein
VFGSTPELDIINGFLRHMYSDGSDCDPSRTSCFTGSDFCTRSHCKLIKLHLYFKRHDLRVRLLGWARAGPNTPNSPLDDD